MVPASTAGAEGDRLYTRTGQESPLLLLDACRLPRALTRQQRPAHSTPPKPQRNGHRDLNCRTVSSWQDWLGYGGDRKDTAHRPNPCDQPLHQVTEPLCAKAGRQANLRITRTSNPHSSSRSPTHPCSPRPWCCTCGTCSRQLGRTTAYNT